MKIKVKSYAKINLTLCVGGVKDGFHMIDSLVTTVDLYDEIAVSPRKDDEIRLTTYGLGEYEIKQSENTAYRAALAFKSKFNTGGVNVEVRKHIPIGGGLGGSSVDAAGVLRALGELYGIDEGLKEIADSVGSDCGYLLGGGTARISGRGEVVERCDEDLDLSVVLLFAKSGGVSTKECYALSDAIGSFTDPSSTKAVFDAVKNGDVERVLANVGNDLGVPAARLNEEIADNLAALRKLSPTACSVTGSGSTTFAIFETPELCSWAADKLRKLGLDAVVVNTVPRYKDA